MSSVRSHVLAVEIAEHEMRLEIAGELGSSTTRALRWMRSSILASHGRTGSQLAATATGAMVANLLAYTDLFRTGVAMSGAYNRTLTPFDFQTEHRTFWEAPEDYLAMSPRIHADRINERLLLIHGGEDPKNGTTPMQSERLYEALQGLGGTVRYVMLPFEGHRYGARESVMHAFWEISRWLNRYLEAPNNAAEAPGAGMAGAPTF